MQISKSRLKQIIKEELLRINEGMETIEEVEHQIEQLNQKSSEMGSLLKGQELLDFQNEYAALLQKYEELGGLEGW